MSFPPITRAMPGLLSDGHGDYICIFLTVRGFLGGLIFNKQPKAGGAGGVREGGQGDH